MLSAEETREITAELQHHEVKRAACLEALKVVQRHRGWVSGESLRIIEQCVNNMPEGRYKSDHPLATPPRKERTLQDIETLITHFLSTSWGPVIPAGEAFMGIEATKGNNGYYLISDGSTQSYRTRIRTPSFAHMQMVPKICKGLMIADLLAILGSVDFILADMDR